MAVPSGWERFTNYGTTINNLFLPHKVPLKEYMTRNARMDGFTTQDLMDKFPNLGMVIDLTQTANPSRYYQPFDLEENGIKHVKINVRGGGLLPDPVQVEQFINLVDDFNCRNPGKLIGVHCTHGLNRTGFMICHYLIAKHGISGQDALEIFETARGHEMERKPYVDEILSQPSAEQRCVREPVSNTYTEPYNPDFDQMNGDEMNDPYRGYNPHHHQQHPTHQKKDWNVPVEYRQRTRVFYNSGLSEDQRWELNRILRPVLCPPMNQQQSQQYVKNNDGTNSGRMENGQDGDHQYRNQRWDTNESWARNVSLSIQTGPFYNRSV